MQQRFDTKNRVLWIVITACAAFLVLWACGVRFPRPTSPVPQAVVEVEEDDEIEPMPLLNRSSKAFDFELPKEPEVVNDERDPEGLPL